MKNNFRQCGEYIADIGKNASIFCYYFQGKLPEVFIRAKTSQLEEVIKCKISEWSEWVCVGNDFDREWRDLCDQLQNEVRAFQVRPMEEDDRRMEEAWQLCQSC